VNNGRSPFDAGRSSSRREFLVGAAAVGAGGLWWYSTRARGLALASAFESPVAGPVATVTVAEFGPDGVQTGVLTVPKVMKTDVQWSRQLSRLERDVLRGFQDEVAFSGAFLKNHEAGIYRCAACDTAVFGSAHKYDSNTGWPAFTKPIANENVAVGPHGPLPNAITCVRCDSFLGDLFDDGPKPDGWRYCINSASMRFVAANTPRVATAVFAGGCFWGVDAVYKHTRGVIEVVSGYAGGSADTADYASVSRGSSRHAEAVQVTYDPAFVSYETLLKILFLVAHDPTQLNRQGPDVGPQYRSAVFYSTDEQRTSVSAAIASLDARKVYRGRVVTEVARLERFYRAEDYHQNYLATHLNSPYIIYNDLPKLEHLKVEFPEWYRAQGASG